jgi:hypothetical protein
VAVDDALVARLLRRIDELEARVRHLEAYRANLVRDRHDPRAIPTRAGRSRTLGLPEDLLELRASSWC